MHTYDCAVMRDPGTGFDCVENSMVELDLSTEDDRQLTDEGFLIREVSATEFHLIVNRMDIENLQKASDKFWDMQDGV